ncbi:NEDD4-binding protein 2-like 2 [Elgaria multicarinata webbii]|uniref:NEDD4-binding protein 2-like 2 n=1 Tax=Elgaria multicarinata webbii TaxID=159646 RepID=UPI002FCCD09E
MLHAECKPRYLESQDASVTEPCSKRMKSTEEPYGKSYDGLQRLHEEVHIKKTHSGFIPFSLSNDHDEVQPEKGTTEDPFNKAFPGKKPIPSKPSGSVNKNEGEIELYSTSKAFIGPIFKSKANILHDQRKKYIDSNCPKVSNATLGRSSKKGIAPKQAAPCDVPKLEDELFQFYSEIYKLESSENCLDGALQQTETNSHRQPVEYNKWNQIVCVNSQERPYRMPPNSGDCHSFYNESSGNRTGSEQYLYNDSIGHRSGIQQCCNNERDIWEAKQLCNRQEGSRFCNNPMPQFRPGWQHTNPYMIPFRPPPPQFTTHFNFQEPNSSSLHSDIFQRSDVGSFKSTHINMSSSICEQDSEYANHFGTHITQTTRNGFNVPDGHVVNGFSETRPLNRKDIKSYQSEGLNIVSQQFPEDKLCESQKLLLILRGLPGSGKTTLSHILLGQSRDGIVFSTDDYFRQNNGCWSYNVYQLGAAHDWNQKRAKQAMDQGRSPIIIDNTNTQAWEMKPYVEAALEKGYRVEFHEPDTWWKFDPEELEKRNEHGVNREKIVQMLERYEYQMSIPIVMNSVLPFHKTSLMPPLQRRQRWGGCSDSWNTFSVSNSR